MRKKKATPRGHINPMAHLTTMMGVSLLSKDDRTVWALEMRAALDAVREAKATRDHWNTIFNSVNLAEEFSRMGLVTDPDGILKEAERACEQIIKRQKTGVRSVRASELSALRALESAMIDVLGSVTNSERFNAEERVRARMQAALNGSVPGAVVLEYQE